MAVDGTALQRDPQTGLIFEHELERLLAAQMAEPVRLTVRRTAATGAADAAPPETLQATLPPTPLRITGLVMEPGPVIGV